MAIALALLSALVYGVSDYCGGRAARSAPLLGVVLLAQLASAGGTALVVAVAGDPFPDAADVAWSVAAGLMSVTAIAAFYLALAGGVMTVVAPITAVISAVVPVVIGIAGGERPSALALGGVALAIVAVALVSGLGDRSPGRVSATGRRRMIGLAVVAGIGFGLLFTFLDRTSDASGFWPLFIGQLTTVPLVVATALVRRLDVRAIGSVGWLAVGAGALAVSANVAYLLATREGLLSLVAVITSMYPASTVVLATLLDGERITPSQLVGLGLAVGALATVAAGA